MCKFSNYSLSMLVHTWEQNANLERIFEIR